MGTLLSGAVGGGVVGLLCAIFASVAIAYFKRVISERDELLKRESERVEREIMAQSARLRAHIESDQTPVLTSEMRSMAGNIEKILSQNTALLVANETQRQQIITLFNNHAELKNELRECRKDHK